MDDFSSLSQNLSELRQQGQLRELKDITSTSGRMVKWKDKMYLNLSSNDYLGLGTRQDILREFLEKAAASCDTAVYNLTSSSSRLLTGNSPLYTELEEQLCRWYGKEASLVFNSGYHANLGILSALNGAGNVIFSDKLNHASLIDGMRLSEGKYLRYRHLDYEHLENLLKKERENFQRALIVSETVFSMDGDRADLEALLYLKDKYDCTLMLDEAHAVGVFGTTGLGLCQGSGRIGEIDIIVGTFGKALASVGAYGVFSRTVRDYLVNQMRPLIFTTALPPLNLAWTSHILSRIPELTGARQNLQELSDYLRGLVRASGLEALGDSQIIPVLTGKNEMAVNLAGLFQERGLLVFPIRPPTVPPGTARIRISLCADLEKKQLDSIPEILRDFIKRGDQS